MAIEKIRICARCNKSFKTVHSNQKYCDPCRPKVRDDYYKIYRPIYNSSIRFDPDIKKRHYTRTKLKNSISPKENNESVEYCRNNYNKVEGCLNCIASECLQPESGDEFLIWEQEGFYEKNYAKI